MKLEKIDTNFAVGEVNADGMKSYDIHTTPFKIYGLYDCKEGSYTRMPYEVAERVNDGVKWLHTNTAGGRLRFRTDSSRIALRYILPDVCLLPHMPATGVSCFDLYADGGFVKPFIPQGDFFSKAKEEGEKEFYSEVNLGSAKMRDILINFPLYNNVSAVCVLLEDGATVLEADEYTHSKPVVYYGSSITQGGCAGHPGNSYEAIISRKLDCDFINLGFSGSCKGEDEMAHYIASLDMSVFVYDYDHNAPDSEWLEKTHARFFEILRAAKPDLPVIMVSVADKHFGEDVEKRKAIIRKTFDTAVANGDKNVYFIDGQEIYGDKADYATVDFCHPNDLGFYLMAEKIGKVIENVLLTEHLNK